MSDGKDQVWIFCDQKNPEAIRMRQESGAETLLEHKRWQRVHWIDAKGCQSSFRPHAEGRCYRDSIASRGPGPVLFERINDRIAFRALLDFIPEKVGSLFSFNSLREDLGVAYSTAREWVLLSEALYYGFFVRPCSKNIKRAVRAEPKFFLFDILRIPRANLAAKRENLTALHLFKSCQFWTDSAQGHFELCFVRDKEKREVDFLIVRDKIPWMLVECKSGSRSPSRSLAYFSDSGIRVMGYENFFSHFV